MADWKAGDVVQLKAGGPIMTVDSVDERGGCHCVWFVKREERLAYYSSEALREAPSGRDRPGKALSQP